MVLEPIEEGDLDLKDKFIQKKVEHISPNSVAVLQEKPTIEVNIERKESVVEKDDTYAKIVAKVKTQTDDIQTTADEVAVDASQTGKMIDRESRINNLVDIAMQKGVVHAARVAKHMNDNYVLDEFHDKLMMDEFHDALVSKGLIKEI